MNAIVHSILRIASAAWSRLGMATSREAQLEAPSSQIADPNPTDSGTHPAVAQRAAWDAVKQAPRAPRAPWLDRHTPPPPSWRPGMA
jgi:hypothetical protein